MFVAVKVKKLTVLKNYKGTAPVPHEKIMAVAVHTVTLWHAHNAHT